MVLTGLWPNCMRSARVFFRYPAFIAKLLLMLVVSISTKCQSPTEDASSFLELMPDQVILAYSDPTPKDSTIAGACALFVRIEANGRTIESAPQYVGFQGQSYHAESDTQHLTGTTLPAGPVNGNARIVASFPMSPKYWRFSDDHTQLSSVTEISTLTLHFAGAGNCRVDLLVPDSLLLDLSPESSLGGTPTDTATFSAIKANSAHYALVNQEHFTDNANLELRNMLSSQAADFTANPSLHGGWEERIDIYTR